MRVASPTATGGAPASLALAEEETPVAVVDLGRVSANARKVAAYTARHGLGWRPHVKTHKSVAVARLQIEAGAVGLTVATPHEAEVMAAVSDDLLLAYPPLGSRKLDRLMALPASVSLTVGLDSAEALEGLSAAAVRAGREVGVLVELDSGLHRVGVQTPSDALALADLARTLEGVRYRGLMFYPGHIRVPGEEQDPALQDLARLLGEFIGTLENAGLAPEVVSGGSSPTLWRSHELPGLTEIRPGTCIYNDRDMVSLGVAAEEECAYTILATVVSTSVPGRAVVDAGSKALSKEELRSAGRGYGAVAGRPEVPIVSLSEEHGILDLGDTDWRPRVGDRVRLLPNHVCVSVNLQDRLLVVDGETAETWPIEGRGRVP